MSSENLNPELFFNRVDQHTLTNVARQATFGNASILRDSLKKGEPHDICDNHGWFPIHRAASRGHHDCVKILLKHSKRNFKDTKTYSGETPLYLAAFNGHANVMKTLLQHGADIRITNNELATVLVAAVKSRKKECVQICLENKLDINAQDAGGWAALHEASYIGDDQSTMILLAAGAKIDIQNSDNATPLFIAAQHGGVDCLISLIKNKASVSMSTRDNATPLFIASQEGHVECVKALLEAGAKVQNRTTFCTTALHTAAERGHLDIIKLLVKAGADVNAKSEQNVTPLFLTADEDQLDCLIELIKLGADVNAVLEEDKGSPLELACTVGSVKCCEELIKQGCDPNRVFLKNDTLETSTLMEAVGAEESGCVEILLRYGADPNRQVYSYPIIAAAKSMDPESMHLLIKYGADVNVIDQGNNTALRMCLRKAAIQLRPCDELFMNQLKCIELLLKAGADAKDCLYKFSLSFDTEGILKKFPVELMKLLLAFNPHEPNIKEYIDKCLFFYTEPNNILEIRDLSELKKLMDSPCSLSHLCRLEIRCILGSKRLCKIKELPVPKMIQSYLEFNDL